MLVVIFFLVMVSAVSVGAAFYFWKQGRKNPQTHSQQWLLLLEHAPVNIMFADDQLFLRYMNPASLNTFKKLEAYLPVSADQMVGRHIDVFHKNPEKVRKILSNPNNLPLTTIFKMGPETIQFRADAMYDAQQHYLGPMVSWELITEKTKQEQLIQDSVKKEKDYAGRLKSEVNDILNLIELTTAGDLTHRSSQEQHYFNEDTFRIRKSLDTFVDKMHAIIAQVEQDSKKIYTSTETLTHNNYAMQDSIQTATDQSQSVLQAAGRVNDSVHTIATGTEEMSASIKEIASNAAMAAQVANNAVHIVKKTNDNIATLGKSSEEIGNIVKVITDIAEQTNLLALNATIEAARAGDVGKGFAVVASEVKELAKETAIATDDIRRKIDAIQTDTHQAIQAIQEITKIINDISDIQNTIATAVDQQSVTSNDMARNLVLVAADSSQIVQHVAKVTETLKHTTMGTQQTISSITDVGRLANQLQQPLKQFKL